jgi:hypothetical protein
MRRLAENDRLRDRLVAAALAGDHEHNWAWGKVSLNPDDTVNVQWVGMGREVALGFVVVAIGLLEAGVLIGLALAAW